MPTSSLADASALASIFGAVASVLALVTTIAIAVYAHRLTKKLDQASIRREKLAHLRDQRRDVREALSAFDEAFACWMRDTGDGAADYEPVHRRAQALLATIEAVDSETTLLAPTLAVMRGHSSWISDPSATTRWLTSGPRAASADAQWTPDVLTAALDVTKDEVLEYSATVDDSARLGDDFWQAPALSGTPNSQDTSTISPHAPAHAHLAAQQRWMPTDADAPTSHRIRALIRYKVNLEHALAFTELADFSNGLQNAPRAERFSAAARSVMAQLRGDVEQHAQQAIGTVNARLEDILQTRQLSRTGSS